MDVVNEYLTSPHKAVRCTILLYKFEKCTQELKVPKKLPGGSGGKGNDKDKRWQAKPGPQARHEVP